MVKYIKAAARAIGLKVAYGGLQRLVLKARGYDILSMEQTVAFMKPYEQEHITGASAVLPQIANSSGSDKLIFPKKESVTDDVYVWDYHHDGHKATVSKYGSVSIEGKAICIDWNHNSLYHNMWKKDEREVKNVPAAIALFSQFQDGIFYGGYYDFIFLVATKLCRIKEAMPDVDLTDITITYPLFNSAYETEYMQLLGVNTANLVDSTEFKVITPRLITANSAHWYPNLADVLALKRQVAQKFIPVKTELKRLYISRKGRRVVTNENELITMLKKFDFVIIEDKPRTVAEQISLYYNASFIIGPHGASFSNIIWCQHGAHLFELFSGNYTPDFFLYLAAVLDLKYSASYENAADSRVDYLDGLVEDIYVSVPALEKSLTAIFNAK